MQTDFLFAQPSSLYGWSRLLSLFTRFSEYNTSPTREEADARALYCDWVMVASDLRGAMKQVESELKADEDSRQGNLFAALP